MRKQVRALAFALFTAIVFTAIVGAGLSAQVLSRLSMIEPRIVAQVNSSTASNCDLCHQKIGDQQAALFMKSAHAKNNLSCDSCHGGNPKATDKITAHRADFTAMHGDGEKLSMCGSCHMAQLSTFKKSLHFPERSPAPRMTCVECHGAHTVGSPSRDFSFALYCTNCHGLEYLPALPVEFQKMLVMLDEQKDTLAGLESAGRKPSAELMSVRKQIRHDVAEIVHATNLRGGVEKLPQILKRGDEFKAQAERERK